MNLGKLLGVVSPGLSATGLFGNNAQSTGGAMLGGMSPLLAALLHKQKGGAPVMPARPQDAVAAPGAVPAAPAAPVNPADTAAMKRKQMGLRLLQLGGQFANSPFGASY